MRPMRSGAGFQSIPQATLWVFGVFGVFGHSKRSLRLLTDSEPLEFQERNGSSATASQTKTPRVFFFEKYATTRKATPDRMPKEAEKLDPNGPNCFVQTRRFDASGSHHDALGSQLCENLDPPFAGAGATSNGSVGTAFSQTVGQKIKIDKMENPQARFVRCE